MIDGKPQNPWDRVDDESKAILDQIMEDLGMELMPWQRTILACMLLDPPGTTYIMDGKRASDHKTATLIYKRFEKEMFKP